MSENSFEQARYNMIEQQIRTWEVLDQRVLDVMSQIHREDFVPERYRNLAFSDVRIPLGHGEVMMNPNVEGRLLQSLGLQPEDRVLEVGTGSGYLTACLAALSRSVTSVDIRPAFTDTARQKLRRHGAGNVQLVTGDAVKGWSDQSYDAVAITGAMYTLPDAWRRQLSPGGRLFAILGEEPIMEAVLITRTGDHEWTQESLFDTELPYLTGAGKPKLFTF